MAAKKNTHKERTLVLVFTHFTNGHLYVPAIVEKEGKKRKRNNTHPCNHCNEGSWKRNQSKVHGRMTNSYDTKIGLPNLEKWLQSYDSLLRGGTFGFSQFFIFYVRIMFVSLFIGLNKILI